MTIRRLRAWAYGVRDGWQQPHDLSSSRNVEHLFAKDGDEDGILSAQDRGINLGQILRAGRRSQAARERWWKVWP